MTLSPTFVVKGKFIESSKAKQKALYLMTTEQPESQELPKSARAPVDDAQVALDFLQKHGKQILAAVVIVIGSALLYAYADSRKKAEAEAAWTQAFVAEIAGRNDYLQYIAPYIESSKQVLAKYPDTTAAAFVEFQLIATLFERGQPDDLTRATNLARTFLKNHPDHPLHAQMALNLGQLLMCQKKYSEAKGVLETAIKTAPRFIVNELRLAYTQCLDIEEAKQRIGESNGNYSQRLERVREKYLDLKEKNESASFQVRNLAGFLLTVIKDKQFRLSHPEYKPPTSPDVVKPAALKTGSAKATTPTQSAAGPALPAAPNPATTPPAAKKPAPAPQPPTKKERPAVLTQ